MLRGPRRKTPARTNADKEDSMPKGETPTVEVTCLMNSPYYVELRIDLKFGSINWKCLMIDKLVEMLIFMVV